MTKRAHGVSGCVASTATALGLLAFAPPAASAQVVTSGDLTTILFEGSYNTSVSAGVVAVNTAAAKQVRLYLQGQCTQNCAGAQLNVTVFTAGNVNNYTIETIKVLASAGPFFISKVYDVPGLTLNVNAGTGTAAVFTGRAAVMARSN
jgi:hypothetical protein